MDVQELRERVIEAGAALKRAQLDLNDARQALADKTCPYKAGDVIAIKGFAYRGKRCRVTSIVPNKWGDPVGAKPWKVIGVLIKKDGTESAISVDWDAIEEKD